MTSETHAKIQSKGLDGTGITEDLAAELFHQVGHHFMAVVELQVADKRGPNLKGKRAVDLVITRIEPAPDQMTTEHVRELARAFHYERALDGDQPLPVDGQGIEPKVSDVLASGARHRPHPFLPADASEENPICDVCGVIESGTQLHELLDDETDEPDETDEDGQEQLDLDTSEPHEYESGPDDSCLHCGQAEHEDFEVLDQPNDPQNPDGPALDVADGEPSPLHVVTDPFGTDEHPTPEPVDGPSPFDNPFTPPTPA